MGEPGRFSRRRLEEWLASRGSTRSPVGYSAALRDRRCSAASTAGRGRRSECGHACAAAALGRIPKMNGSPACSKRSEPVTLQG